MGDESIAPKSEVHGARRLIMNSIANDACIIVSTGS